MTKTWLNVGRVGARVGVGGGVTVGVGVGAGVGDGVDAGVGVTSGLGVAVGVGFVLDVGVGLLTRGGVGVAFAGLVGCALGVPTVGPRATGGCVVDAGVDGGPSSRDVIHKSSEPTAAQMTSRRPNHMSGTPPTHH